MTKIKIIAVGSLSPKFKSLYDEYVKQVGNFCSLSFSEIKEFSEEKNIEVKKEKETKLILESIIPNSKVILLSLKGKQVDSVSFSKLIESYTNQSITFVIGGSDGVCENYFDNALKLSFSQMTFPHQLFRIMLIEQVYRAFMILNNSKYHK